MSQPELSSASASSPGVIRVAVTIPGAGVTESGDATTRFGDPFPNGTITINGVDYPIDDILAVGAGNSFFELDITTSWNVAGPWYDGTTSLIQYTLNATPPPGLYTLNQIATSSVSIVFPASPTISAIASADTINAEDSIQFSTSTNGGYTPFTFSWDFNGGAANTTDQNPLVQFNTPGTFAVTLTATDEGGTSAGTAMFNVTVIGMPRERRVFFTDFHNYDYYNETIDYGGTELPTHYDVIGSVFTTSEKSLNVSGAGKLVYNGTFELNNFAVYVLVRSTSNAIFSIQTRYSPSIFAQATFDFEDDLLTLEESANSSGAVVSAFDFADDKFYVLGIWAYDGMFYTWINDYQVSTLPASPTAKTFALDFVSGDIELHMVKVYELVDPIDPSLEGDRSNLLVEYRKFLQSKLATVTADDWDAYREAHNRNRWNRHIGRRNVHWDEIGYPAPIPSTDAFFNDS